MISVTQLSRSGPAVSVPGTDAKLALPEGPTLAWYAGIGAMVALELIEWPVALVIGTAHAIQRHTHNRDIQALAEGIESGS
ncbi:MAG: hypothetical protein NVSMB25_06470 [Thermoleophilaceae bacterium]